MTEITSFSFDLKSLEKLKEYNYGMNWPVVYISENGKEVYIGQSTRVYYRFKEHAKNPERRLLKVIHIITDEEFNLSAALDIESWFIQYMSADGKFVLQNSNGGLQNHNYYDREKYRTKFELAWDRLKGMNIVINSLEDIKNSDLFKYSPYKALSKDQLRVADTIFNDILTDKARSFLVQGKPGTGKTVLATYLFKYLKEATETKDWEIALVIPMSALRKTIKKVFRNIRGLRSSMVIGPNDVVKKKYDLIIVDEVHRLRRRRNITNYAAFDKINKQLRFTKEASELDWIVKSSNHQILFYDPHQSVRPSDIRPENVKSIGASSYNLSTQMRVKGGEEYIKFIEDIFDINKPKGINFKDYDFKMYENIADMINDIKSKNKLHGLSRMVAGYAWPWHTKKGKQKFDIEIEGQKLVWNQTAHDWVNSPNAINEVGCIHTVQGYDLNYIGVIIGPELSFNKHLNKFEVDKKQYFDINGHAGITDPSELERYIVNIYKTLLTRGILGTYIYVVDDQLRSYMKTILQS